MSILRRAPHPDVALRPDLFVTAPTRVRVVAREAAVAVHAGGQAVPSAPPVVVVILRQLDRVALRAARFGVTELAVVGALVRMSAHETAVVALPVRVVI